MIGRIRVKEDGISQDFYLHKLIFTLRGSKSFDEERLVYSIDKLFDKVIVISVDSLTIISLAYSSLPKTASFIERDDGQIYDPLFSAVRLHGITDSKCQIYAIVARRSQIKCCQSSVLAIK